MPRIYPPPKGLRGITIRRFFLYYMVFAFLMVLPGIILNIWWPFGIVIVSLVLFPLIFAQVLERNSRKSDELFEPPAIWVGLAVLCLVAFAFMVGMAAYMFAKGGAGDGAATLVLSAFPLIFSIQMLKSARKRRKLWRLIKQAKRMRCPVCGARVPNSVGICSACGAIVFWVPLLSDNQRMQVLAYLRRRSLDLNLPFDANKI